MKALTVDAPGPRALVVHGNDLCAEFYLPLAGELAARRIASTLLTLPGFHQEPPLDRVGWRELVDEVLDRFTGGALVGHSLGGLFALLAAARRPPGLTHLVLLEPAILPWRWLARSAMGRYEREVVHGDRERFSNDSGTFKRVHDPERYPRAAIDLYLECRRAAHRPTISTLLAELPSLYPLPFERVEAPALILVGGSSGRRARLLGRVLARRLRGRMAIVPGAGHWLANEQDAAIASQIAGFVI